MSNVDRATFDGCVPPPRSVSIATTASCNLKCPMCVGDFPDVRVGGRHMDIEVFRRIAGEIFPFVEQWQPSVNGEPLITRDLDQMLEFADRFGVKLDMVTNGTIMPDRLLNLIAPQLGRVMFSMDGADKETFEWTRKGAHFEKVQDNVRRLVKAAAGIPRHRRPKLGVNCTVMRRNIEQASEIVALVHDLGLEFLVFSHVLPFNREFKAQSLVHDRELARRCFDAAEVAARRLGISLSVQPLDNITATTALSESPGRVIAGAAGIVEGLGRRDLNLDPSWTMPGLSPDEPGYEEKSARRRRAWKASALPRRYEPAGEVQERKPISVCDLLWNRIFVDVAGLVSPCCVEGAPVLGSMENDSFEQIWNSRAYRTLRERMVAGDPVSACRGCQHIKELTDPVEIDRWLQGRRAPDKDECARLPEALDCEPTPDANTALTDGSLVIHTGDDPPRLRWERRDDVDGHRIVFSENGFLTSLFSTRWSPEPPFPEPEYTIPASLWSQAPVGQIIQWRALGRIDGEMEIVGRGLIARGDGATQAPRAAKDADPEGGARDADLEACPAPPTWGWEPDVRSDGYHVEVSVDGFRSLLFSTAWHHSRPQSEPRFEVTPLQWKFLPLGRRVQWRALALRGEDSRVIAEGSVVRGRDTPVAPAQDDAAASAGAAAPL